MSETQRSSVETGRLWLRLKSRFLLKPGVFRLKPTKDQAFGAGKTNMPFLAFNTLQTDTERSEHSGMMNLMKGMFGVFRNVAAHAPKVHWAISEQDALDLLTIASLLHRRLDGAIRTQRVQ